MIDFVAVLKRDLRRMAVVTRQHVDESAEAFAQNWRERFGEASLIGDATGVPGSAEPLSEYTLEARFERGYDGLGMLDDPSLQHVEEYGQIKDSIEFVPVTDDMAEIETGGKYVCSAAAFTEHPIFPMNEFGLGVPPRTTLLPTNNLLGPEYKRALRAKYEALLGKPVRWKS